MSNMRIENRRLSYYRDKGCWNKAYYRIVPSLLPFTKKYKFQEYQIGIVLGGTCNPKWKTIKRVDSIFEIRKLGFRNINRYKNKKNAEAFYEMFDLK